MMQSNISLESNVYPVRGSIITDKRFLSQITDYNRIYSINSRFRPSWEKPQSTILKNGPFCSLNHAYRDPCYGVIKTEKGAKWVGMCTLESCPRFSSCRQEMPYDPEKEKAFIPSETAEEEYGYIAFSAHNIVNKILVGDYSDYSVQEERADETLSTAREAVVSFSELIRKLGSDSQAETAVLGEASVSSDAVIVEPTIAEQKPEVLPSDIGTRAECISNKPEEIHDDIMRTDLNVFEHFRACTQEDIIRADSRETYFVDAGPGTGKTYTLIQRINHMVTDQGVNAEGILVLCFTNAAVEEIKTRLKRFISDGADRSLANVDVRTFHSFAWWLISQANEQFASSGWRAINLQVLNYETTLIRAGEVISRFGSDVVACWEHFVVDEVQDLTNTLGRFVLRIVDACVKSGCGITVLGDACQAIYDYEQEVQGAPLKSVEFYRALYRKLYQTAKFVFLKENHRQTAELIRLTSGLRDAILSEKQENMQMAVDGFIDSVKAVDTTGASINEEFLGRFKRKGSVCLLLRNNGQTLKLSSDLRKRGISHTLNISETPFNFAPWIADVFATYAKPTISEDEFCLLLGKVTPQNAEDVWARLQRMMHTDNDVLNVRSLLNAIASSKVDDPLIRSISENKVIVSNIHRSKGREYDSVIVDEGFVKSLNSDSPVDEYKTMYVAITRPKSELLLAPLQSKNAMKPITIFSSGRKRWGKAKCGKIVYFEFDNSKDADIDSFAHTPIKAFDAVRIGDEVCLRREINARSVSYSIIHEDTGARLGSIGQPYIQDLMGYMRLDNKRLIELPATINDIYISGIYSQVVNDDYLKTHPELLPSAPNGIWKWAELVGIGHADYDVY